MRMDREGRARLKFFMVSWLFLQVGFLSQFEAKLLGDHICQKDIVIPKEVIKWELRNRTIRTYKWCMNVPPRCSYYSNRVVNESRIAVVNVTTTVEECCDGFKEQNNFCISKCPDCLHGICLKGTCVCQIGFTGPLCDSDEVTVPEYHNLTITTAQPTTTEFVGKVDTIFEGSGESFFKEEHEAIMAIRSQPDDDDVSIDSDSLEFADPIAEEDASAADYRILIGDIFEHSNSVRENREESFEELITTSTTMKSKEVERVSAEQDLVKENLLRHTDNLLEEKFEKRSSVENFKEDELGMEEAADKNLIYSICSASLATFLILVVVVTLYAVRNSRKKVHDKGRKKDVASVAVYTSSIFHSPLPVPPMFDNPTYLAARPNANDDTWNMDSKNNIEAQEFNVVFQKPLRNPKLAVKHYLYDHPPSTGSYRASSDVDIISQYSLSQKNAFGIISEPVYDEIPSKDEDILNVATQPSTSSHYTNHTINKVQSGTVVNSLYMNTCGRTHF